MSNTIKNKKKNNHLCTDLIVNSINDIVLFWNSATEANWRISIFDTLM